MKVETLEISNQSAVFTRDNVHLDMDGYVFFFEILGLKLLFFCFFKISIFFCNFFVSCFSLINSVLYYQVVDPVLASYEIEDAEFAIRQLAMSTMRSEIGQVSFAKTKPKIKPRFHWFSLF